MKQLTEEDLHAYVDGQLSPERRTEVEAWLAGHPEDDVRVRAWARQNQRLHDAFDGVLNEPVPLDLLRASSNRQWRWKRLLRVAASVLLLVTAGWIGYEFGVRDAKTKIVYTALPQEAALAHAVFSPELRHPVEVDAHHSDHLVAWLSKRLGVKLAAPDFRAEGFELLGGRLLSGGGGPVAHFMYQDGQGRRITLYVRRAPKREVDTGFRHTRQDGVEVFYWVDRDLGYALSGAIGRPVMQRLADAAYQQIER